MPSDAGLVMMSSPDRTGAVDNAVAPESQIAAASSAPGENGRNGATAPGAAAPSDQAADPWFAPGPKVAGGFGASSPGADTAEWPADAGAAIGTDDYSTTEWFMPTGRAGLLPDSMTDSWEQDAAPGIDQGERREAAGAPPWAGDPAGQAAGAPPPWENGPWPGPSDPAAARAPVAPPRASGPAQDGRGGAQPPGSRRRSARIVLAGGATAVALVVIIVVIVTGTSGGSGGGCGTYPAAVRQAYAQAMRDIRGGAAADVQAADLGLAARRANASAASAGQISVRTALFAMASDLEQAHADVAAHRAVPSDLRQRLTADGTALPASCPG